MGISFELENNHKIIKIDSRILYVIFLFVQFIWYSKWKKNSIICLINVSKNFKLVDDFVQISSIKIRNKHRKLI